MVYTVQFSHSVMSDTLWPHGLQHTRPPCPSPTPDLAQTHVHWVSDAIQPSHSLLPSSPPALNLPQHQGLFQWISSLHQVAKGLELQLQHQPSNEYSGLISFRIDRLDLLAVQGNSQKSSPAPQCKSINSSALGFLNSSTLTSVHDFWKNHSFEYMDLCQQSEVCF